MYNNNNIHYCYYYYINTFKHIFNASFIIKSKSAK